MTNESLTKDFLSSGTPWDRSSLSSKNITEDNVLGIIDSIIPNHEWTYDITNICNINNGPVISVTLYLPGIVISSTGFSYKNAVVHALRDIIAMENSKNVQTDIPKEVEAQQPKMSDKLSVDDVLGQISNMNENIKGKNKPESTLAVNQQSSLLDEFFNSNKNKQQATPEPVEQKQSNDIPFFSKEAEEVGKQVEQEIEDYNYSRFNPSPESVNPTNRIFSMNDWASQGDKVKAWMQELSIKNKEEFSAWTRKWCGLDYDHFDPQYLDYLIRWSKDLREKQTY